MAAAIPSMDPDQALTLADAIDGTMYAHPGRDWTASQLAPKVHAPTHRVRLVLGWMVDMGYVDTTGNGAWTHYHHNPDC